MNLLKFWIGLLPPISIKQRFRYEKNRRIANRLQLGSWNFRSRQTNSTTRFFERKSVGVFKMSNQFVEIVQKASRLGWCTRLYCTTCLNHELREEFRKLAGEVGFELAEQLAELAPSEVVLLPNWENRIRLAFLQIALPGPQQKVLDAWANKLDREIRLADIVLFYVVRILPFGQYISSRWIDKCISLALETRDESLTESLIWTLGRKVIDNDPLSGLVKELAASSKIKYACAAYGIQWR